MRVYEDADSASEIVFHIRKGGVVEIRSETQDGNWYLVESGTDMGWVESRYIRRYESREQADNARQTFIEGGE